VCSSDLPRLTFHLKSVGVDLPARARVIDDLAERRTIMARVARAWHRDDVDVMVDASPLIEVRFQGMRTEPATETASATKSEAAPA